ACGSYPQRPGFESLHRHQIKILQASLWIPGGAFVFIKRVLMILTGFEKIVEERILAAQRKGEFDNLEGAGKPLEYEDLSRIPQEMRLAYKILKNADCLPPEVELKNEIVRTEKLLESMEDEFLRYRTLKKLNYLIMKLNMMRGGSAALEIPQHYEHKVVERLCGEKKKRSP
ncbi:MAG: DnaJ family domain-containing protein, partial [Desulfosalsimonas sp.]